jgi:multidrug resistance protein MdtO
VATIAYRGPHLSDALTWVRNLLREEMAPYPGRVELVARIVFAATLVMTINMTFRIPYGAYGAIFALILSREHPQVTLHAAKTMIMSFCFAAVYVLIGAIIFSGDPILRFLWVLLTLFLIFFGMKVVSNYTAAARFGYLLIITIPLWDQRITGEEKVVQTLWAVGAISYASLITALIEFIYARLLRVDSLTSALIERLQCVAAILRSWSRDSQTITIEHQIIRLATLGTSRMRQDLLRSGYSSEVTQQMGAIVALVGRLVDLGANLREFSSEILRTHQAAMDALAARIEILTKSLILRQIPDQLNASSESAVPKVPVLGQMDRTVSLILEVLTGSDSATGYHPPPKREAPAKRFFVPDAFSNPDYVQFAIRGGLAATLCYLTYNLIAWNGISTAVTTCYLTALSTIGASRQKQILRFGGAIVGGVILGFGAQVFLLPAIDSIVGFLVLFVVVSIIAAWVTTSGPRLSYFGVQIAVAFYLINLQEFKFQTSLAVARDRVAGILLGLMVMWLVFDQLWGASALREMHRTFVSSLRLLAQLMRAPISSDSGIAIEETYSLRDRIATNFETLRQHADGVTLEFGKTRQHDLATRSQFLRWQLRLREVFRLRITLLKYRLVLPGFELPEPLHRAQLAFDTRFAERLESLADNLSAWKRFTPARKESSATIIEEAIDKSLLRELSTRSSTAQTFISLLSRLESSMNAFEHEIELGLDDIPIETASIGTDRVAPIEEFFFHDGPF